MKKILNFLLGISLLVVGIGVYTPRIAIADEVPQSGYQPQPIPYVLLDYVDRYSVTAGGWNFDFYKGTTGYNKIYSSSNSTVLVSDDRLTLEYKQGTQWKQRGTPRSVTSATITDGFTITRHYDDFSGTTYDAEYKFITGQQPKLTITLNNGQTSEYRVDWALSGLSSNYTSVTNRLQFTGIALDWSDVTNYTTTPVVTTSGGAKKADITFNIGTVNSGSQVVIDPLYEYWRPTMDNYNSIYGIYYRAETFTNNTTSFIMSSVNLYLYRVGDCGVNNFNIAIRGTTSSKPNAGSGNNTATGFKLANDITAVAAGGNYTFTLSTPVFIQKNVMYAIVVWMTGDGTHNVKLKGDSTNNYLPKGRVSYSNDNDVTWNAGDLSYGTSWFETYGVLPTPEVTTNNATDVSYTSANMSGNITQVYDINVATRGFQWGTNSGNYTDNWTEAVSSGNNTYYSHNTTGLIANTTYYYRAVVINSYGNGYGAEKSFTTLAYVAPTVTTANVTSYGKTWAIFGGNITDTGGVNSDNRGVEWGLSTGNYSDNWSDAGSWGIGTFSSNITTLSTNTTYYVKAWAYNSAGTGFGSEKSFTTIAQTLPIAPTNFTVTQNGLTSASANWTMGANAVTTVIRWSDEAYPTSVTEGWELYNDTGTSTNATSLNLLFTTYYFSAWSHNSDGYSVDYVTASIGGSGMNLIIIFGLIIAVIIIFIIANNR